MSGTHANNGSFHHGDSRGAAHRFQKGHATWNKGVSLHLSPQSEWKEGDTAGERHPQWKGGVQHISNDCAYVWAGANVRLRLPRAVYEKAFGKIPKGFVIWHKDEAETGVDAYSFTCLCLETRQALSQRKTAQTDTITQLITDKDRRLKIKNDKDKVKNMPTMKAKGLSFLNLPLTISTFCYPISIRSRLDSARGVSPSSGVHAKLFKH